MLYSVAVLVRVKWGWVATAAYLALGQQRKVRPGHFASGRDTKQRKALRDVMPSHIGSFGCAAASEIFWQLPLACAPRLSGVAGTRNHDCETTCQEGVNVNHIAPPKVSLLILPVSPTVKLSAI